MTQKEAESIYVPSNAVLARFVEGFFDASKGWNTSTNQLEAYEVIKCDEKNGLQNGMHIFVTPNTGIKCNYPGIAGEYKIIDKAVIVTGMSNPKN